MVVSLFFDATNGPMAVFRRRILNSKQRFVRAVQAAQRHAR